MKEALTKVINSLILPKYNEINSVFINIREETKNVHVNYIVPNGLKSQKRARELEDDTKTLFKMIGFPKDYELNVWY